MFRSQTLPVEPFSLNVDSYDVPACTESSHGGCLDGNFRIDCLKMSHSSASGNFSYENKNGMFDDGGLYF